MKIFLGMDLARKGGDVTVITVVSSSLALGYGVGDLILMSAGDYYTVERVINQTTYAVRKAGRWRLLRWKIRAWCSSVHDWLWRPLDY